MLYAGVDEVGRGCLAGPVIACAVILPAKISVAVQDSKRCSPRKREYLSQILCKEAVSYSFGLVEAPDIDRLNIRNATFLAMAQAIAGLSPLPDHVYIDGDSIIPSAVMEKQSLFCSQESIIKGDSSNPLISSASILAKVYRDNLMISLSAQYPEYGFNKHKGYGTKEHYLAIYKYGSCPIHRKTFSGVQ